MIHSPVTTRSQMGEDTHPDGVQSEDATPASEHLSSVTVEEGSQGLNQSHVPEGNKLQGTIKEATPVALRTRSRLQSAPIRIDECEGEVRQTDCDRDYQLILPFFMHIKKQQCIIDELNSAVKHFLKSQSIVESLQGTITKLSERLESQEKFNVTVQQVVKPFTPANKSIIAARDAEGSIAFDSPYEYHDMQNFRLSPGESDSDEDEFFPQSYGSSDSSEEVTPKETSSLNNEIDEQRRNQYAFMATPTKQRLTFDLKNTSIDSEPDTPDTYDSVIIQICHQIWSR